MAGEDEAGIARKGLVAQSRGGVRWRSPPDKEMSMGMDEYWMDEVERILDQYGAADPEYAVILLRGMGFDPDEAEEEVEAYNA